MVLGWYIDNVWIICTAQKAQPYLEYFSPAATVFVSQWCLPFVEKCSLGCLEVILKHLHEHIYWFVSYNLFFPLTQLYSGNDAACVWCWPLTVPSLLEGEKKWSVLCKVGLVHYQYNTSAIPASGCQVNHLWTNYADQHLIHAPF